MARVLVMFKDQRTARAVFGTETWKGCVYTTQLRHVDKAGNETQFGWGWDPREVLVKYAAGRTWDAVHWRWDAPDELRAVLAPHIREVAVA